MARDVLDLVGDRAAVGLAQVRQRVFEVLARDVDPQDLRRDAPHQLRRQVDRVGVERRVADRVLPERVERRGEVAVGAVGLDQRRRRLHGLQQLGDVAPAARPRPAARRERRRRLGLRRLGRRAGGGAERREDALVEAVLALQVALDRLQEAPRLRALDDAVVVGRGHRHDLLGADLAADVAEPDGVGDRARGDDRALADHQPRHRGDRCRCRPGWSARCSRR